MMRRLVTVTILAAVLASPLQPWITGALPRARAQSPPAEDFGWTVVVNPETDHPDNRAGATIAGSTATGDGARATVAIQNRTAFLHGEGAGGFVLGALGISGGYTLAVEPASGVNVNVRSSLVTVPFGLLLPIGTTSWNVTAMDVGQQAEVELLAKVTPASTVLDLALMAIDGVVALVLPTAAASCFSRTASRSQTIALAISIAPEFNGAGAALRDLPLSDAIAQFGAAMLRAFPRIVTIAARIVAGCPELAVIGFGLELAGIAFTGGLSMVIKVALLTARLGTRLINYVNDVFVADLPATVMTVSYQPPPALAGISLPEATSPGGSDEAAPDGPDQAPVPVPIAGPDTSTVLVQDVSASMEGEKLFNSVQATRNIVDLVSWDAESTGTYHQIGVVAFESGSRIVVPMTADPDVVRAGLGRLVARGNTNMGAGLADAIALLDIGVVATRPVIILLSDGKNNRGLSNQQVLAGPVAAAAALGICIYTVGFGSPGDLDEAFLREVAARTGCGEYNYAAGGFSLESAYIQVRHSATGGVLQQITGTISEGERKSAGEITVPPDQKELQVTLNWPGSQLELDVTDPTGQRIDDQYDGAHLNVRSRLAHLIVDNPLPGEWTIDVVGVDVPGVETRFTLVASVRAGEQTTGTNVAVVRNLVAAFLVVLFAFGISAYIRPYAREDN